MKHTLAISTIISFLFSSFIVSAQGNYRIGEFYNGQITHLDGKIEKGYIIYNTLSDRNQVVYFYKDKNNRKTETVYQNTQIKGYQVGKEVYHSIEYIHDLNLKYVERAFGLVVKRGQITTYQVVNEQMDEKNTTKITFDNFTILKKGDEVGLEVAFFIDFKKVMSEFVSEHKALAQKVKDGEKGYRFINQDSIIEEYNKWYSENG